MLACGILLPRHKQEIEIVSSMEEWQLRDEDSLFSGEAILGIKKNKKNFSDFIAILAYVEVGTAC